jgi:2-amino-4-hydroxy-6-hydroxymethyldihydropteridine diphosphokinase
MCEHAMTTVRAQTAEQTRGRARTRRWGPRTLDVDVISVDAIVSTEPRLTLPHPRAHERAFVLAPWLDVDPDAELVGRGPVRTLLRQADRDGVRRWRP